MRRVRYAENSAVLHVTPRRTGALLAAVLLGTLGGCTAPRPAAVADPATDGPVVLATFTVLADMAQVVAGPDAQVASLTGPGTEIHGFEPSPDDLRRAAGADLMLSNGLGLEVWLEALVAPLDIPTVVLTAGIDPIPVEGGQAHAGAAPLNPHAWMSPREGKQYVVAIAAALSDLDPVHAEGYQRRAAAYQAQIETVRTELVDRLSTVPPGRRLLVTCEGAFSYLARDAGLQEAFLWPVNAERQGTPQQVAAVIRSVRAASAPAVFCESTVPATAQQQVARETDVPFGGVLFVDSLSEPDGPVPTYLDLLRYDVDVIVAGLTGTGEGTDE